jgi:uncharacterized protein YjiS (DUF1127 family)
MSVMTTYLSTFGLTIPKCCIAQALQEKANGPRGRTLKETTMFVSYALSKLRSYLRYRETVRELSALSDRELDDLGISRFQIDGIAREHAFA